MSAVDKMQERLCEELLKQLDFEAIAKDVAKGLHKKIAKDIKDALETDVGWNYAITEALNNGEGQKALDKMLERVTTHMRNSLTGAVNGKS